MGHQLAYRAAADGKHPVSKITITSRFFAIARRPAFAAAALFVTAFASTAGHAQSGPFAGMAGTWSGGGSVSLDDGSNERIRCRATYQVGGPRMTMNLVCASDSYKFNLGADVQAQGSAVSGSWTETSRNINGTLQGRGGGGQLPGCCQRARLQRRHRDAHQRQPTVGDDQGRQSIPRRQHHAVEVINQISTRTTLGHPRGLFSACAAMARMLPSGAMPQVRTP
ncbi:hypothetical protein ABIF23_002150 [Bradyrhizobium elkanii]